MDLLRKQFSGSEPQVKRVIELMQTATYEHETVYEQIDNWFHEDGNVVLIGDACHPMLVRLLSFV